MANCNIALASLITDVCSPSIGGIKKVWVASYAEGIATIGDEMEGETKIGEYVSGFTSGTTWHSFTFRKNTGSMTSTLNVSENGNYVSTELSLSFSKMETAKRMAMQALALADVVCVVLDCNGKYWFLGNDNPVNCSAGAGETGTQKTDANRYTLTLTDESLQYPYEVAKTVGDALPE